MPTFKIDVAMDVRTYGYIEVDADSIDDAVEIATPDFIKENFENHGGGSDDFDFSSPRDIWLGDFKCEDTGEEGFVEKDLPNSHYPGGLVHDHAQDLLKAVKAAVDLVERDVIRVRPSEKDELLAALAQWNESIAKAEGHA